MDEEDFLAAVEADNANVPDASETVEPVEETAAETPEPAAEPVAEPAPVAEPVAQEHAPAPQHVPLAAMLDERDKRKALEAQLAQFRAQQAQQQPEPAPDMFEDPDGYRAFHDQRIQQALYQSNLQWSERIAAMQHGEETTRAAKEWGYNRCETDPYFNAKVAASADPVGFVVSEWKREQIASQVTPDDFEQFKAWREAQAQVQAVPQATQQAPSRAIPPRSLASAPSAGGVMTEVQQSDEEIFGEVFSRKE